MRIATFNLENLDFSSPDTKPSFEERKRVLVPQLNRLRADILLLQEVYTQEKNGEKNIFALTELLAETPYADYNLSVSWDENTGEPYSVRNIVTVSRLPIIESEVFRHTFTPQPRYRPVTAQPPVESAIQMSWERPILYTKIAGEDEKVLHVINLHLKSKNSTTVAGQKRDQYSWNTAAGWAEGFFISSVRRVGQALETRVLVDRIFDEDENAAIVVGGDFNAELNEVAVEAIEGSTENTGNESLNSRILIPCELSVPETKRYTLYHKGEENMLDHIFISRSLLHHYDHTEIHNEILKDESIAFATDDKFPESDHAPVVAEFFM